MTIAEAKEQVRREYYQEGGTTFSGTPLSDIAEAAIERFIELAALGKASVAAEPWNEATGEGVDLYHK